MALTFGDISMSLSYGMAMENHLHWFLPLWRTSPNASWLRRVCVKASNGYVSLCKREECMPLNWDVVTDVITRSRESVDILNWPDPEHDTGREFHARIHPDDREVYGATEARLTPKSPAYKIAFRSLHPDGTVTWLEDTGRASFDTQGKMVKVIGMVADITERKRVEEALRENEDQLRLLLDSTAEAIYGIDLRQRCTFCNPACVRILGYRHIDEILGENMHDLIHHTRADGTPLPMEECRIHQVTHRGRRPR